MSESRPIDAVPLHGRPRRPVLEVRALLSEALTSEWQPAAVLEAYARTHAKRPVTDYDVADAWMHLVETGVAECHTYPGDLTAHWRRATRRRAA